MGRALRILVMAVAGFWLLGSWLGSDIAADTPVSVLPADAVILHLPRSPSVDRIVSDMRTELHSVATSTSDSRIADALRRIGADDGLMTQVATSPVEMFDNGQAAATATAVYDIQLDIDQVTLVVVTVELVPAVGSTAASREHEDGHSLINRDIASRCTAQALRVSVEAGLSGERLVDGIVNELSAANEPVHATYHEYVENARYGQHIRLAQEALDDVTGCASATR